MEKRLSKSECSKIKELILRGEAQIEDFTEKEINSLADYLLETFNPDSESDTVLLEQCYAALGVPSEADEKLSKEEYKKIAGSVIGTFKEQKTHMSAKRVFILVAAVIAILAMTGCGIIGTIIFDVLNLGKDILNIKPNESAVQGDMEIIRTDDYVTYDNIEDLIEDYGDLDIGFDMIPDEYCFASAIEYSWSKEVNVLITFSNQTNENIEIIIMSKDVDVFGDEYICVNNVNVYLSKAEFGYQASWTRDGYFYSVQCTDKDFLIDLLYTIKEN